jgi:multicomponent K+:H+ antiporter subunit G
MTEADVPGAIPLWLEIVVAVLVLSGAALALLGSTGLLRLRTFFERVHAPAIIATLGCWLIMHGTVLYFTVADRSIALHALLIAVFVAITVPIMSIFLMRAALFRARQAGRDVPPSLSQPKGTPAPPAYTTHTTPPDPESPDDAAVENS